ncbi:hypothetical protein QBC44DRAFT_313632 [Cladorrhinum sp. PSN332]|nr:hypothetical protein QBC44DRAFT_313632 [Cladorrhinum sp. PSN332]
MSRVAIFWLLEEVEEESGRKDAEKLILAELWEKMGREEGTTNFIQSFGFDWDHRHGAAAKGRLEPWSANEFWALTNNKFHMPPPHAIYGLRVLSPSLFHKSSKQLPTTSRVHDLVPSDHRLTGTKSQFKRSLRTTQEQRTISTEWTFDEEDLYFQFQALDNDLYPPESDDSAFFHDPFGQDAFLFPSETGNSTSCDQPMNHLENEQSHNQVEQDRVQQGLATSHQISSEQDQSEQTSAAQNDVAQAQTQCNSSGGGPVYQAHQLQPEHANHPQVQIAQVSEDHEAQTYPAGPQARGLEGQTPKPPFEAFHKFRLERPASSLSSQLRSSRPIVARQLVFKMSDFSEPYAEIPFGSDYIPQQEDEAVSGGRLVSPQPSHSQTGEDQPMPTQEAHQGLGSGLRRGLCSTCERTKDNIPPNGQQCLDCAGRQRSLREMYKALGLCPRGGNKPGHVGGGNCPACALQSKKWRENAKKKNLLKETAGQSKVEKKPVKKGQSKKQTKQRAV